MAGLVSVASAQEAIQSAAVPSAASAPASEEATTAPVLAPEGEAPATPASPEPVNSEAESSPVPTKIDPSAFQQSIDEPLPLIPESGSPTYETDASFLSNNPGEAGVEKTGPLKKGTAEQLRQAIRIRELKTLAHQDTAVIAELARAQSAATFEGRRVALRNYYTLLNAKIVKADPSLKEALEGELRRKLARLEQHRVRPSKLIEPIKELAGSRSSDHGAEEKKQ